MLAVLLLVAACSSGESSSRTGAPDSAGARAPTGDSGSSGATALGNATGDVASASGSGSLAPNPQGRIPVLEYHVIGGDKNTLYTRTVASYKADLDEAYKLGYRPVTIAQMLEKDWRELPPGTAPAVFVFDDASDSQFRYLEQNGKLVIDPTSAVGIWLDFARTHPGWK
ncbi:MAG TPA: hypothetical protein VKA54_17395, partial [Gemmatimonadaceae bacterium]|nr:hypothetical protein [Gemmatimonadaceae bacterium]